MAVKRGLLEPLQSLGQVARRAAAVVIVLAEFVRGLQIAFAGRLLASAQRFAHRLGDRIECAAGGCWNQQRVTTCHGQQGQKKQQAAKG